MSLSRPAGRPLRRSSSAAIALRCPGSMRAAIAPLTLAAANEVPLQLAQPVNASLVALASASSPARMLPVR